MATPCLGDTPHRALTNHLRIAGHSQARLGQAIAGRRFMIRFQSKPRERQAYRDVDHDYVLRDGEARASPAAA